MGGKQGDVAKVSVLQEVRNGSHKMCFISARREQISGNREQRTFSHFNLDSKQTFANVYAIRELSFITSPSWPVTSRDG